MTKWLKDAMMKEYDEAVKFKQRKLGVEEYTKRVCETTGQTNRSAVLPTKHWTENDM